ncbi:MAG: hypothetical protein LBU90_09075 [Bacteroidales bacterium]|nr:hypothetical protein [Bacteroidales bacterium]
MKKEYDTLRYFWHITSAHTIAYFVAGIFGLAVMNYKELFATDILSSLMLPVDSPIVALGPALQLFRGILIALVLLPLRKTFFEEKYGLLQLGLLILGLSLFSTIGPTSGSFDGFIYTKIPVPVQILGYPEAIFYVALFVVILHITQKYAHKKIILPLSIVCVALICTLCIFAFITRL